MHIIRFLYWLKMHISCFQFHKGLMKIQVLIFENFFPTTRQLGWLVLSCSKRRKILKIIIFIVCFFISQCWPKSAGFIQKIFTDSLPFIHYLSMLPMSIDFSYLELILTICNLLLKWYFSLLEYYAWLLFSNPLSVK